jgi:pSer/pThr/pTyr-binding forkhead associated (FHA) protein
MDPSVSGKHAAFAWSDGALAVTDLGSKNGTSHNDVRLSPHEKSWVQPMDRLQFGRVEAFLCDPRALRAVLLQEHRAAMTQAV